MPIIDEFLPVYDFNEVHTISVNASPQQTMLAVRELRASELSPLVFWMLALRELPGRLFARGRVTRPAEGPFLAQLFDGGFSHLADTENEIVFGLIGQFWKLVGGQEVKAESPQAFRDFQRTDFARVAANLLVRAEDGRTILSTETRIQAPDAQTRRKFAFYWRLISLGSGWIRVLWLRAIKRRAEKGSILDAN